MNYPPKTIWITGASSGIGEALAQTYAAQGNHLILSARNRQRLDEVAEHCRKLGAASAEVAPLDLADEKNIRNTASQVLGIHPKLDVLVNNGGISQRSNAEETPVEIDRKIMETNFFGAVVLTKAALPALMRDNGGQIIVISSVVGKFGFPLRTAYSASKHALQGYFEALRAELHAKHVRVLIVSPGRIRTNISINAIDKEGKQHGVMDEGQAKGMPADVCAKKIIAAAGKNKKELWVGGKEVVMVYIRKYLPRLFHYMARKVKPT